MTDSRVTCDVLTRTVGPNQPMVVLPYLLQLYCVRCYETSPSCQGSPCHLQGLCRTMTLRPGMHSVYPPRFPPYADWCLTMMICGSCIHQETWCLLRFEQMPECMKWHHSTWSLSCFSGGQLILQGCLQLNSPLVIGRDWNRRLHCVYGTWQVHAY